MPRASAIAYNIIEAHSSEEPIYIIYATDPSNFYVIEIGPDGVALSAEQYSSSDYSPGNGYTYCQVIRESESVPDMSIMLFNGFSIVILCPDGTSFEQDFSSHEADTVYMATPIYDKDNDKIRFFTFTSIVGTGGNNYQYTLRNMSCETDLTGASELDQETYNYPTNDPGDMQYFSSYISGTIYGCTYYIPDEYVRIANISCDTSTGAISKTEDAAIERYASIFVKTENSCFGLMEANEVDGSIGFTLANTADANNIDSWTTSEFDELADVGRTFSHLEDKISVLYVDDDLGTSIARASVLASGPELTLRINLDAFSELLADASTVAAVELP